MGPIFLNIGGDKLVCDLNHSGFGKVYLSLQLSNSVVGSVNKQPKFALKALLIYYYSHNLKARSQVMSLANQAHEVNNEPAVTPEDANKETLRVIQGGKAQTNQPVAEKRYWTKAEGVKWLNEQLGMNLSS